MTEFSLGSRVIGPDQPPLVAEQVRPGLEAMEEVGAEWECQILITYPNDDAGGRRIMAELSRLEAKHVPFIQVHRSLGRFFYHGILNVAAACVGNSSSGIKETPAFHCPTVNVGRRQQGRLRGDNILDVDYDKEHIKKAIGKCLFDREFQKQVQTCENPYGVGNAGPRIAEVLATTPITPELVQKKMTY